MAKNGILYFHQGWTDIINCLGLINYYCNKYDKIYLLIREDAKNLIDFYITDLIKVQPLYETKDTENLSFDYVINKYKITNYDLLGIGIHASVRNDEYRDKYSITCKNEIFFVEAFYISYNIPYITRINDFTFTRNYDLEKTTYQNFVNKYGNDYIIYHEVIRDYDESKTIVNLNGISDTFFDMITVLENALEIHLLDSVWGAFIYQLDAKYKLFKNKKIILYADRGYKPMFTRPIQLDNWIII
jgi:hypothetical protein